MLSEIESFGLESYIVRPFLISRLQQHIFEDVEHVVELVRVSEVIDQLPLSLDLLLDLEMNGILPVIIARLYSWLLSISCTSTLSPLAGKSSISFC